MSPPPSGKRGKHSESGLARFLGSGTSGILELLIFHPVDTVAKRLMSNQKKVRCERALRYHCVIYYGLVEVRPQRTKM